MLMRMDSCTWWQHLRPLRETSFNANHPPLVYGCGLCFRCFSWELLRHFSERFCRGLGTVLAAGFTWFTQVPRWCLAVLPMLVFVTVGLHLALWTTGLYGRLLRAAGDVAPQRSVQLLWRSFLRWSRIHSLRDSWPEILTTLVFALHAVMPAVSTFSALHLILPRQPADLGDPTHQSGWDNLHRLACVMLGV